MRRSSSRAPFLSALRELAYARLARGERDEARALGLRLLALDPADAQARAILEQAGQP